MSFHKWMVGFFLAFLMVNVLIVNSLLFSARSFQFNLSQLAPSTQGILSVEKLLDAEAQIEQVQAGVSLTRGELAQVEQALAAVDARAQETRDEATAARAVIASSVSDIESRNALATAEPAGALDDDALLGRVEALRSAALPEQDVAAVQRLRGQAEALEQSLDQISAAEQERRTLLQRQSALGGQVADADRQVFAIKQGVVDNYEQYDRIRSEAMALIATSPLGIGAGLVQAHPTFMSTVLVLLMGLLGAILYLFPAYMSRANPVTFAEIGVRSLFGMVTALAFYIVANASIAGLAFVPGGQASEVATAINPFTVSLIGIVAGIMADDIAKWIHRRGTELLGGSPGVPQAAPAPAAPASPPAASRVATTADAGPGAGVNPHGGPYDPSVG